LLSMAEALSRLIPNADSCVISVIRHRERLVRSSARNRSGEI
jgi:hypothetical protein